MGDISLIDVGLEWFADIIREITSWFADGIEEEYQNLTEAMFGTSTPQTRTGFVFGEPLNSPWTELYDSLVGGEVVMLSLLILVICVQARHTIRIFNVRGATSSRVTRRSAWTGGFLIVTWYWIATLVLYLVDGLTLALLPNFGALTTAMLNFVGAIITNPALSLSLAGIGGTAMWILKAIYVLRDVLLYVYLYGMPLGIAVTYGNIPVLSRVTAELCKRFIPLAIMPLPAAVLFRGYDFLFGSIGVLTITAPFSQYLIAVSLPVLAVILTWKLFAYASPLTTRAIQTATHATVTLGAATTAAYAGNPAMATSILRSGPRRTAERTAVTQYPEHVVEQKHRLNGRFPNYRRTENEPDR